MGGLFLIAKCSGLNLSSNQWASWKRTVMIPSHYWKTSAVLLVAYVGWPRPWPFELFGGIDQQTGKSVSLSQSLSLSVYLSFSLFFLSYQNKKKRIYNSRNKHMENCVLHLIIRKVHLKATIKHNFTYTKITMIEIKEHQMTLQFMKLYSNLS